MLNFSKLLSNLIEKNRLVFHSEDDFKFSLSQVIIESYPNFSVRLEKPVAITMLYRNGEQIIVRAPFDIILVDEIGNTIPIELKYKTKKAVFEFNEEEYSLANHSAYDVGRYSFRKDIYRIEKYLEKNPKSTVGYVLILTNDQNYSSSNALDKNNIDKYFTFHQGAIIPKKDDSWNYQSINQLKYSLDENDKKWKYRGVKKNHWTCRNELFYRLDLKSNYVVNWQLYSAVQKNKFEYCLLEIISNNS